MRTHWDWEDEPFHPAGDEDIPALVRLARRARGRRVTFTWHVHRGEVEALSRAIREWTTKTSGRYRAFDAQMLAALGAALG
jgi:hypothetical protein